jgi:uncharacterized protein YecE (DUF72 family)
MSRKAGRLRIGASGYEYAHWRGAFYPPDLPKKRWFTYYAQRFDTVEINYTFYRLPPAHTFDAWRDQAPEGFSYALKFSRYATHLKHLKEPDELIKRFLERASRLGEVLGPILVQLPPHWHADTERLTTFLQAAPRGYRWAVEFRDPDWFCDEVFDILRAHGAALCIHDLLANHPQHLTTDWGYWRFHGRSYGGTYAQEALQAQARTLKQYLNDGLDVFVYFNNDAQGYAVQNAADLRRYATGD